MLWSISSRRKCRRLNRYTVPFAETVQILINIRITLCVNKFGHVPQNFLCLQGVACAEMRNLQLTLEERDIVTLRSFPLSYCKPDEYELDF